MPAKKIISDGTKITGQNQKGGWALKRNQFQQLFMQRIVKSAVYECQSLPLDYSYWILVFVRIFLTLIPQFGYIHPDEFMQNLEPMAGRVLNVEHTRSWEFNSTFPIRNIALSHIFIGIPLQLLSDMNHLTKLYFNIKIVTPYSILIVPRIMFCVISFVNDFCLYKISRLYGENTRNKLFFLASSYISIVYATHTLSNSLEIVLLSLLLFAVSDCMLVSKCVIEHNEILVEKYEKATDIIERIKLFKLKKLLPSHSLSKCFYIASITVIGTFNRPTFPAFAFPSVFLWFMRGLGTKYIGFKDFHLRLIVFLVCCIPSLLILIILDSSFYGFLTLADVKNLRFSMECFVVTPLNFIKYNLLNENLAEHGLHPRWLHVFVNIPILFNILGVMAIATITKTTYRLLRGSYGSLPKIQSIDALMTFSVISPVALLSIFPHQEPRFLTPILVPMIFLYTKNMEYFESDGKLWKRIKYASFIVWCICNIALTVFFGFLHQGGIYSFANHINKEVNTKEATFVNIHVVTSHVYTMPQSLFLTIDTTKTYYNRDTGQSYKLSRKIFMSELGSKPMSRVVKEAQIAWKVNEIKNKNKDGVFRVYVILPSSLKRHLTSAWLNSNSTTTSLVEDMHFYPHFSSEAAPYFPSPNEKFCDSPLSMANVTPATPLTALERIYCFLRQFSLVVYKIEHRSKYAAKL